MLTTSVIKKTAQSEQFPKVRKFPIGENSPNLVILNPMGEEIISRPLN
jgi:hypothetical protein